MRAFLDFEASSLAKDSYPIEVAWVFEDGREESHLIQPAEGWIDWDLRAERIHRISPEMLQIHGEPADEVARRLVEALSGHQLYASAPSWDGKWMSLLIRNAGFPRHLLRLQDTQTAQTEAIADLLGASLSAERLSNTTSSILAQVAEMKALFRVDHRALPDARMEHWAYQRAATLARRTAEDHPLT